MLAAFALVATLAASSASAHRPPPPRETAAVGANAVEIAWPRRAHRRAELRYRRLSARHWRRVSRGRARRLRLTGLRPGALYAVQLRFCRRHRCTRWSRTLRVRAPDPFRPAETGNPGTPAAGTPGTGLPPAGTGGCPVFPADNAWNQDVSQLPVDPRSAAYVGSIGASGHLHPDFGSNPDYGIPYVVVGPDQPKLPVRFTDSADESDPGPYPIPAGAPIEAGSDRHVIALQTGTCRLYELFGAQRDGSGWAAGSGAAFDLRSNALRPEGWTSADAAGLPIFPGLVRRDEVASGHIDHALRVTVSQTQDGYMHPATHAASSSSDPSRPPMGLRLRLKAGYDVSHFHGASLVILQALRRYGMIVADNGSSWYITGATDTGWDDEDLNQLKGVPGSAFEVVDTGEPIRR